METAFIKGEARRLRYRARARKARIAARFAALGLMCILGAAVWQDDTFGARLKQHAKSAIERFEDATDPDSKAGAFVQTALMKLNF